MLTGAPRGLRKGRRRGYYYLLARKTGRETVINPFKYKLDGKDVLMTSLVVPIRHNARVVEVAGVDMALADFDQ
ncbi:MAG: hypothetical protein ABFD98_08015 [Syntrophobacteraceae bacterium]